MEGMLAPKQQRESCGQFGLKMALLCYWRAQLSTGGNSKIGKMTQNDIHQTFPASFTMSVALMDAS
jgi:hypothetical protein